MLRRGHAQDAHATKNAETVRGFEVLCYVLRLERPRGRKLLGVVSAGGVGVDDGAGNLPDIAGAEGLAEA